MAFVHNRVLLGSKNVVLNVAYLDEPVFVRRRLIPFWKHDCPRVNLLSD